MTVCFRRRTPPSSPSVRGIPALGGTPTAAVLGRAKAGSGPAKPAGPSCIVTPDPPRPLTPREPVVTDIPVRPLTPMPVKIVNRKSEQRAARERRDRERSELHEREKNERNLYAAGGVYMGPADAIGTSV